MDQVLFYVTCTTCKAKLAVRDASAVGEIYACPKCESMVQIIPPADWVPSTTPIAPEISPPPFQETPAASVTPPPAPPEFKPDAVKKHPAPPPLTKVGAVNVALEESRASGKKSEQKQNDEIASPAPLFWLVGGLAVGLAVTVVVLVWWVTRTTPQPQPPAAATQEAKEAPKETPKEEPKAATPEEKKEEPVPGEKEKAAAEKPADEKKVLPEAKPEEKVEDEAKKEETAETPKKNEEAAQPDKVASSNNEAASSSKTEPPKNEPSKPSAKLVKLVPPEELNIDSRLQDVIPTFEFKDAPFAQALGAVATVSGLSLTLDPDAFVLYGVSTEDPVSLKVKNATVEKVFADLASLRGLEMVVLDDQVVITAPGERPDATQKSSLSVADLCKDADSLKNLSDLIRKFIEPGSWKEQGGFAEISAQDDKLSVRHTKFAKKEIVVFCEKLRLARHLPVADMKKFKKLSLETRDESASAALNKKVSVNYTQPAELLRVLSALGRGAGMTILLNRHALASLGMSDQTQVSYATQDMPLSQALADVLAILKLDYRAVDSHTLQISSPAALGATRCVEFYRVGEALKKAGSADALLDDIRKNVATDSWSAKDSQTAIAVDEPSETLIVLQSPPVQRELGKFLAKK